MRSGVPSPVVQQNASYVVEAVIALHAASRMHRSRTDEALVKDVDVLMSEMWHKFAGSGIACGPCGAAAA